MKVKVMGLNPGYLLKPFLLYVFVEISEVIIYDCHQVHSDYGT